MCYSIQPNRHTDISSHENKLNNSRRLLGYPFVHIHNIVGLASWQELTTDSFQGLVFHNIINITFTASRACPHGLVY